MVFKLDAAEMGSFKILQDGTIHVGVGEKQIWYSYDLKDWHLEESSFSEHIIQPMNDAAFYRVDFNKYKRVLPGKHFAELALGKVFFKGSKGRSGGYVITYAYVDSRDRNGARGSFKHEYPDQLGPHVLNFGSWSYYQFRNRFILAFTSELFDENLSTILYFCDWDDLESNLVFRAQPHVEGAPVGPVFIHDLCNLPTFSIE